MDDPVVSAHTGRNADLISEVCRLYAPDGSRILDMTYGQGRFWKKVNLNRYRFLSMDIEPIAQIQADIRKPPFTDASFDIAVLDPPYVHNSGVRNPHSYASTTTRYNGSATTARMYNADILELYREAMCACFPILNPDGGQLWVKCKDEVEREVQRWSHIKLYEAALSIGYCARDLFILTGMTAPQRWPGRVQWHARKLHSYLWVFERPDERYRKLLTKPAPSGLTTSRKMVL
jgi:hypothetical protein